jgi:hypothetical protein
MRSRQKMRVHPESISNSQQFSTNSHGEPQDQDDETILRNLNLNSEDRRLKIKGRLEFLLSNVKSLLDDMYISHIAEYLAKAQSSAERIGIVTRYTNMIYSLKKELSEIEDIIENVYQSIKIFDLATEDECSMNTFIKECIYFVREVETECSSFFEETSFCHMARMIMLFKLDRRFLAQIQLDYKQWALHNLYQLGLLTKQNATLDEHNLSTNSGRSPNKGTDVTDGDFFAHTEHGSKLMFSASKPKNSLSIKSITALETFQSKTSFVMSPNHPISAGDLNVNDSQLQKQKKKPTKRKWLFFVC